MAYFANKEDFDIFAEERCYICKFYERCPILDIHMVYNYEQLDDQRIREILSMLLDEKEGCIFFEKKEFKTVTFYVERRIPSRE